MFFAIILVFMFLALFILLMLLRNVFSSDLRKAINHHKKSVNYAEKGDYEKAKLHSEIANIYRERTSKKI